MRTDKSHKTAIFRNCLSAPIRYLKSVVNKKKGEFRFWGDRILDYGCGRGTDADFLGSEKYDPHFFPDMPSGKFHLILCTYVLNSLPKNKERIILEDIKKRLFPSSGKAYISVRRDIKISGYRKNGTFQRNVKLDLPLVYERKGKFAIYVLYP
jgi:hypothetical protein